MRNAYGILVVNLAVKRSLGRARRRWEGNIKIYITEALREVVDWINVVQDRDQCRALVNMVTKIKAPQKEANFLTS
jgi:hypothetical protein